MRGKLTLGTKAVLIVCAILTGTLVWIALFSMLGCPSQSYQTGRGVNVVYHDVRGSTCNNDPRLAAVVGLLTELVLYQGQRLELLKRPYAEIRVTPLTVCVSDGPITCGLPREVQGCAGSGVVMVRRQPTERETQILLGHELAKILVVKAETVFDPWIEEGKLLADPRWQAWDQAVRDSVPR